MKRFIFVTGGVISGIGKGIIAASIGRILIDYGVSVSIVKADPYINYDAGLMNPFQHGEVFVTKDGAETDMDLGTYERFLDLEVDSRSNFTAGSVYHSVIERERKGEKYLGQTVQTIPHVTDEIKDRMCAFEDTDVTIVEIGGTVGDYEIFPFLEAARQISVEYRKSMFVHVSLVYTLPSGENKSKPTQHSVRKLNEVGIRPDLLVCRAKKEISDEMGEKLSTLCGIPIDHIFSAPDVDLVEKVPVQLRWQGIHTAISNRLKLNALQKPQLGVNRWEQAVFRLANLRQSISIGVLGKYVKGNDSYVSVQEALKHAGLANSLIVDIVWIDAEEYNCHDLTFVDGLIIPGGFGERGVEAMITAITYCRSFDKPLFGICLGMQLMAIEYMRNVVEDKNADDVIVEMPAFRGGDRLGESMRLGDHVCTLRSKSLARRAYKTACITQRHRHRCEINKKYRGVLETNGFHFTGTDQGGYVIEVCEVPSLRWFLGCQYHPEFTSSILSPHPLFVDFLRACKEDYHADV